MNKTNIIVNLILIVGGFFGVFIVSYALLSGLHIFIIYLCSYDIMNINIVNNRYLLAVFYIVITTILLYELFKFFIKTIIDGLKDLFK